MKLLLVGAGGYAGGYINRLLNGELPSVQWVGVVDPYYGGCKYKEQIDAAGIPVYDTVEDFYACQTADFAVVCTPTFLHCNQSVYALSQGSHVLCEKPAAPTMEEVRQMRAAEEKYGRFLAIGYQWSYAEAIQNLKTDILNGVFGKPISLKTVISWPRNRDYYQRGSGWGGKIRKDGKLVLDSIASNACAHYLHNMLFVLGDTMETSAVVAQLQGECYRANDIENFDTCSIKMTTEQGAQLYFVASHAAKEQADPEFIYTFEKGQVFFGQNGNRQIIARFYDGGEKNYGNPFENDFKKLQDCVAAAEAGTRPVCTVETTSAHVSVIEMLYRTTPIRDFPRQYILENAETNGVYVEGLYAAIRQAYEQEVLFSQLENPIFG